MGSSGTSSGATMSTMMSLDCLCRQAVNLNVVTGGSISFNPTSSFFPSHDNLLRMASGIKNPQMSSTQPSPSMAENTEKAKKSVVTTSHSLSPHASVFFPAAARQTSAAAPCDTGPSAPPRTSPTKMPQVLESKQDSTELKKIWAKHLKEKKGLRDKKVTPHKAENVAAGTHPTGTQHESHVSQIPQPLNIQHSSTSSQQDSHPPTSTAQGQSAAHSSRHSQTTRGASQTADWVVGSNTAWGGSITYYFSPKPEYSAYERACHTRRQRSRAANINRRANVAAFPGMTTHGQMYQAHGQTYPVHGQIYPAHGQTYQAAQQAVNPYRPPGVAASAQQTPTRAQPSNLNTASVISPGLDVTSYQQYYTAQQTQYMENPYRPANIPTTSREGTQSQQSSGSVTTSYPQNPSSFTHQQTNSKNLQKQYTERIAQASANPAPSQQLASDERGQPSGNVVSPPKASTSCRKRKNRNRNKRAFSAPINPRSPLTPIPEAQEMADEAQQQESRPASNNPSGMATPLRVPNEIAPDHPPPMSCPRLTYSEGLGNPTSEGLQETPPNEIAAQPQQTMSCPRLTYPPDLGTTASHGLQETQTQAQSHQQVSYSASTHPSGLAMPCHGPNEVASQHQQQMAYPTFTYPSGGLGTIPAHRNQVMAPQAQTHQQVSYSAWTYQPGLDSSINQWQQIASQHQPQSYQQTSYPDLAHPPGLGTTPAHGQQEMATQVPIHQQGSHPTLTHPPGLGPVPAHEQQEIASQAQSHQQASYSTLNYPPGLAASSHQDQQSAPRVQQWRARSVSIYPRGAVDNCESLRDRMYQRELHFPAFYPEGFRRPWYGEQCNPVWPAPTKQAEGEQSPQEEVEDIFLDMSERVWLCKLAHDTEMSRRRQFSEISEPAHPQRPVGAELEDLRERERDRRKALLGYPILEGDRARETDFQQSIKRGFPMQYSEAPIPGFPKAHIVASDPLNQSLVSTFESVASNLSLYHDGYANFQAPPPSQDEQASAGNSSNGKDSTDSCSSGQYYTPHGSIGRPASRTSTAWDTCEENDWEESTLRVDPGTGLASNDQDNATGADSELQHSTETSASTDTTSQTPSEIPSFSDNSRSESPVNEQADDQVPPIDESGLFDDYETDDTTSTSQSDTGNDTEDETVTLAQDTARPLDATNPNETVETTATSSSTSAHSTATSPNRVPVTRTTWASMVRRSFSRDKNPQGSFSSSSTPLRLPCLPAANPTQSVHAAHQAPTSQASLLERRHRLFEEQSRGKSSGQRGQQTEGQSNWQIIDQHGGHSHVQSGGHSRGQPAGSTRGGISRGQSAEPPRISFAPIRGYTHGASRP